MSVDPVLLIITIYIISILVVFICTANPLKLIKSCLTNKQFDNLIYQIFNDSDLKYDKYRVKTKDYKVWIASGYCGFQINEVYDFSFYQKFKFYRAFKKFKKTLNINENQSKLDKLKVDRLTDMGNILYSKGEIRK